MAGKQFLLVNVLKSGLYSDCHIRGSINVPLEQLEEWAQNIAKEMPIVVYCASYASLDSKSARGKLSAMGFQNLWTYQGGMNEWYNAGLPVEGACRQKYLVEPMEERLEAQIVGNVHEINVQELKKMIADSYAI